MSMKCKTGNIMIGLYFRTQLLLRVRNALMHFV